MSHIRDSKKSKSLGWQPRKDTRPLSPADQTLLSVLEDDWRRMYRPDGATIPPILNPRLMDQALPYAFIMESGPHGAVRIRVAGQRLHDFLGMDPRGMSFGIFFNDDSLVRVGELVQAAFQTPALVQIPLTVAYDDTPVSLILLPMRCAKGMPTRMTGAFAIAAARAKNKKSIGAGALGLAAGQPIRCEPLDWTFVTSKGPTDAAAPRLQLVVDNTKK